MAMPPGGHPTKLFINYRREDTAPYAGRLYDRLVAHFGEDQVFMDIDQIEPGEDFVEVINRKVGACEIAIISIGPKWLSVTDATGQRRLDDSEDLVRIEILAALERRIRVIPVLVGGAPMPRRQDLPEALAQLSRRNAIELSETRFHADVTRLIEAIEKARAPTEQKTVPSAAPASFTAEPVAIAAPESKVVSEPSAGKMASTRLVEHLHKTSESPATCELSEGSKTQTGSDLMNDHPNYLAKMIEERPIGLRYKVGFYIGAWIFALVATIPGQYSKYVLSKPWQFPRGLTYTFHLRVSTVAYVTCLSLFFIHAVILFRSRSRRKLLILFGILFVALVCTVAGWY
jgi:hypothetical protein